jgi:hypothetical protein
MGEVGMCKGSAFLRLLGVVAAFQSAAPAEGQPVPHAAPPAPTVFATPQAVFDAYRTGDRRTAFFCLTPEFRDSAVFEAYFACHTRPATQEVLAVLKRFGADDAAVHAEYCKRYKEKHGVDIAKVEAEYEAKMAEAFAEYVQKNKIRPGDGAVAVPESVLEKAGPRPPQDAALARQALIDTVVDKAGFVVAVGQALGQPDGRPGQLGPLKGVQVKGDRATDQAAVTVYHLEARPGTAERKVGQRVDTTFHFRKTKDGWLIEFK